MEHSKEQHLIIRADASTRIGTGHLMRCLALAQAWKDAGHKTVFATACQNEDLLHRLRDEEFGIHLLARSYPDAGDWDYTKNILAAYPGAWVVLDGYHFDDVYQRQVKELGHRLLVVDDMAHLKHYYADILLNQNLHAQQLQYSCEPYTRLLLGTRYVLLRREFLVWKDWKREVPEVARRVLLTLGGADPENHTLKVIQALAGAEVAGLEVTIVMGASNPHMETIGRAIGDSPISVRTAENPEDMGRVIKWADVAIAAAGVTTWELLFMGTPALFLALADNQESVGLSVSKAGAGLYLGHANAVSRDDICAKLENVANNRALRKDMSAKGRALVDGSGTVRVVNAIKATSQPALQLRHATQDDCSLLWEWANEAATRKASFTHRHIAWEEHQKWFTQKINDPACHILIACGPGGKPVGQVRFEITGESARVSTSVEKDERNKGYGSSMIRIASDHLFRMTPVNVIHAYVKDNNPSSLLAFKDAGFASCGEVMMHGQKAVHLNRTRDTSA
jgi:UDP-2,4-diacetamido-2,4,6-trideoxy-beta-L-altropyranose hydrolase